MAKGKKAARKKKEPAVPKQPRSGRLPGMEDAGIPALEKVAEALADVRAARMKLTKKESGFAEDLLALMKKHNKVEYHHEEVHVWRRVTEEKVRVKIGELDEKELKKAAPADMPKAGAAEPPSDAVDAAEEVEEVADEEEFAEYEDESELEGEEAVEK